MERRAHKDTRIITFLTPESCGCHCLEKVWPRRFVFELVEKPGDVKMLAGEEMRLMPGWEMFLLLIRYSTD
jgi:hypothetical protein